MASYKYSGIQEFIAEINSLTSDIEFTFRGRHYSISPVSKDEIYGGSSDSITRFESVDDLLDNFIIDGHPIKEIISEIEIL